MSHVDTHQLSLRLSADLGQVGLRDKFVYVITRMTYRTERRIEFRDTDAAGIVHFSAFFPMMESAEHEMLRSLGFSVMQPLGDGTQLTWPRVAATCDYTGAARFEDVLSIEVAVEHLGTKSVRYGFRFDRNGVPVASGTLTAVCCRLSGDGHLDSIPIPDDLRGRLQAVASR